MERGTPYTTTCGRYAKQRKALSTQMNIEQRQKIVFILSLFSVTRLDPVQDPDPSDVSVSESYNF